MRINLWFSPDVKRWHWVLMHGGPRRDERLCNHEGGESIELRDALEDIARTVENVERCYQSDAAPVAKR